jgi:hypothetical protein
MTRKEYDELQSLQAEMTAALKAGGMSPEEVTEMEHAQMVVAGRLLSIWFPIDWGRRAIMAAVLAVGIYGLVCGPQYLAWVWVLLPTFSPRVVGNAAYLAGRFQAGANRKP